MHRCFSALRVPTHGSLLRLSHSLPSPAANFTDVRLDFVRNELEELPSLQPMATPQPERALQRGREEGTGAVGGGTEVEISHPWPEWVVLMERLPKKGYLDRSVFQRASPASSLSASKDSNHIRTACLNFARDHFDLIRWTRSTWAFLNEPPVIALEGPSYKYASQYHVANFDSSKAVNNSGIRV